MGRVGLVRILKGVILFLAALGAVFYGFIFPEIIREMGAVEFPWLVGPSIAAVSVSALPIAAALWLFWRICAEIGQIGRAHV